VRSKTLLAVWIASFGALALGQHSPAPSGPAEGPRMVGAPPPSGIAPGIHPPAPSDGERFAPGPPPTAATAGPGEVLPGQRPSPAVTPTSGSVLPARTATPRPPARTPKARRTPGAPKTPSAPRLSPTPRS